MDEEEYEFYLEQIENLIEEGNKQSKPWGWDADLQSLETQCRDENGLRVPGCYRVPSAPVEYD
jgi:hypothetical protein